MPEVVLAVDDTFDSCNVWFVGALDTTDRLRYADDSHLMVLLYICVFISVCFVQQAISL